MPMFILGGILLLFRVPDVSLTASCPLQEVVPYKTIDSSSVWFITKDCTKVPIRNSKVYFTYFDSWNEVTTVAKSTINRLSNDVVPFLPWGPKRKFENGSLVKTVNSPDVYLLVKSEKFRIDDEDAFRNFGLEWDWVEDVDERVVRDIKLSSVVLNTVADVPPGVMVLIGENPRVYEVERVSNNTVFGREQEKISDVEQVYRKDRIFRLDSATAVVSTGISGSTNSVGPSSSNRVGGPAAGVFSGSPSPSPSPSPTPSPSPSPSTDLALSYTTVTTQTPGVAFGVPMVITNNGTTNVTSIVVSTTIPTNFVYTSSSSNVTFDCSNGSPAGTNCNTTISSLTSGSSTTVTLGVTPTSTYEGTTTFSANITSYTASVADSNLSNNSSTQDIVVDGSPDLSISLTPSLTTSTPSTTIIFTVAFGNNGTVMSTGTALTTAVPTGTVFVSASSTSGWSCSNGSTAGTSCQYDIPSLTVNATGTVLFAVRSLGNYVSTITTTISISDNGTYGSDSDTSNNSATATSTAVDYLLSLSDEFSGSSLDSSWTSLNPSYFTSSVSTGSLHMTPQIDTAWFNTDSAGSYYKTLTSNFFKMTSLIRARSTSPADFSTAANGEFHLGGINIRNTSTTTLNYVHLAVGDPNDVDGAGNGAPNATEVKTTVNGVTTYTTQAISANPGYNSDPETRGDSQLRICRVNQIFYMYRRPVTGGTWSLIGTIDRSASTPLSATVAAGPVAYVYQGAPGLRASFDYVQFSAAVASQSDCTTD